MEDVDNREGDDEFVEENISSGVIRGRLEVRFVIKLVNRV